MLCVVMLIPQTKAHAMGIARQDVRWGIANEPHAAYYLP